MEEMVYTDPFSIKVSQLITLQTALILSYTYQGSLTLPRKPWKPGFFLFTFPGLENAWNLLKKWGNHGILTQNLEKNFVIWNLLICKLHVSKFTFKNAIYKKNLIYIFVISTLSTQTLILSQIDLVISLLLPGNNLENTWNFVSPEKWERWHTNQQIYPHKIGKKVGKYCQLWIVRDCILIYKVNSNHLLTPY